MSTSFQPPGGNVHVIAAVMLALTWASIGLRLWTRAVIVRSFGWDDITALITQVSLLSYEKELFDSARASSPSSVDTRGNNPEIHN